MRNLLCCLLWNGTLLASRAAAADRPPAPPTVSGPVIDSLAYSSDAEAQRRWHPLPGSPPVERCEFDGASGLKLSVSFRGTRHERVSWDRPIDLDLTDCRGLVFEFFCADPTPVSYFNLYLQSGSGWYSSRFYPSGPGWSRIELQKPAAGTEGTPAGWAKITQLRLSAWRGEDRDTTFYITDLRKLGGAAPIVVVAGTGKAAEAATIRAAAGRTARLLDKLEIDYSFVDAADVTPATLRGKQIVILPYNPNMASATADEIVRFVGGGGKLVGFYALPDKVAAAVGMQLGRHLPPKYPGYFASIRPADQVLAGLPPIVQQASWNIRLAQPVAGRSRVAAWWFDKDQVSTKQPAIVVSDNGIFMTHILLAEDPAGKERLMTAMLGHFQQAIWLQVATCAWQRIGQIGPYTSFDAARQALLGQTDGPTAENRVRTALDKAERLEKQVRQELATRQFPTALDTAAAARETLTLAYCRACRAEPGEQRGFWCHSAMGISGMDWDEAIQRLAKNGFNAIFPNMLWGGVAYYPSDILPRAREVATEGDQVAECLAACKKYGVACHVWKVNWNMGSRTPRAFVDKMHSAGRTQVLHDGTQQPRWLCPSHPENFRLERDALLELVRRYDVTGIHLDYIRYPGPQACFCPGCRKRFEAQIGQAVKAWPADVDRGGRMHAEWLDFRRANITRLVEAVHREAKQIRPTVQISAAVFRNWPVDRDGVGQDWKVWCDAGWLDFVCPMDYFDQNTAFESMVARQKRWAGKVPCYPGIGMSVWRDSHDIFILIDQIRITRSHRTRGFTIFNYDVPAARQVVPLLGEGLTRRP